MKRHALLIICLAGVGIALSAGTVFAAFQVRNTGQIDYYSNVAMAYKYVFTDTADIRVLFGPNMYLAKNIKNEITNDSSADMVLCGRGDTVSITLYSANNVSGADTGAWHVVITDTFALFMQVGPGQNASAGPAPDDSFTYLTGSETSMSADGVDGFVAPDSIAYYTGATRAGNWADGIWSGWQEYATKIEPAGIQGIRWYYRYVPSQLDPYSDPTDLPYNLRVSFQILKNDN